jgi:hypothetical protein
MTREPTGVVWMVDGEPFYSFDFSGDADFEPFHHPFFFIFNIAVGGNWPGYPNASTKFPQRLVVDYIRVFGANGSDEDSDGDGVIDPLDDLPLDPNSVLDTDGDGLGNEEDTDDDGDGVLDVVDAYPLDGTRWSTDDESDEEAYRSSFLLMLVAALLQNTTVDTAGKQAR